MKKLLLVAAMLALMLANAAPALAQSTAAGDQYGSGGGREGTIQGVLTSVSSTSVRVDENPSRFACTGGKEVIRLTQNTKTFYQLENGEQARISSQKLRVGQKVKATYLVPEGPVQEICPPTYDAERIVVVGYQGNNPGNPHNPGHPGNPPAHGQYPPDNNPGNGGDQYDNPGSGGDQYNNPGNDQYGNGGDQYGNGGNQRGNVSGGGGGGATAGGGGPSLLPDTGGALIPAVGIGALLIGGGLLARRILW